MAEEFTMERTLGEGAFGKVYLVTNSVDNKQVRCHVTFSTMFKLNLQKCCKIPPVIPSASNLSLI